jgi:hypothetical protein
MTAALFLLSTWLLFQAISCKAYRWMALYVVSSIALCYTNVYCLICLVPQAVIILANLTWTRSGASSRSQRRVAGLAIVVVFVAVLPLVFLFPRQALLPVDAADAPVKCLVSPYLLSAWNVVVLKMVYFGRGTHLSMWWMHVMELFALFVAGLFVLRDRYCRYVGFMVAAMIALTAFTSSTLDRQFIFYPNCLAIMGLSLSGLSLLASSVLSHGLRDALSATVATALCLFTHWYDAGLDSRVRVDYRDAADRINQYYVQGDKILCVGPAALFPLQYSCRRDLPIAVLSWTQAGYSIAALFTFESEWTTWAEGFGDRRGSRWLVEAKVRDTSAAPPSPWTLAKQITFRPDLWDEDGRLTVWQTQSRPQDRDPW